jgi:hypothetical protein
VSRIEGLDQFFEGLTKFEDEVAKTVETVVEVEVRAMQVVAADLVPVDTGVGRDALLDPSTFRVEKSPDGPGKRVIYGLDPKPIQRRAFHLFWVEFGTKAYQPKDQRHAGFDKKGRRRWRKVKTAVPARPAQPFWRPADANMRRRLESKLNMARVVQLAKRAAGFADQS